MRTLKQSLLVIPVAMFLSATSGQTLAQVSLEKPKFKEGAAGPSTKTVQIGDLVSKDTVVTLDTTVRCTSGGKTVKCPAKMLVITE